MRYITERCDWKRPEDDKACLNEATFLVGIGTRRIDGQKSCSRHVSATIIAMVGAEAQQGDSGKVAIDKSATVKWFPNGIARKSE